MQPSAADAWEPARLEYRFACSAPLDDGAAVLVAGGFEGGHLDWHSVDRGRRGPPGLAAGGAGAETIIQRAGVPVPVTFDGMPNARYWTFEDGRTNLGDVSASTTDLATPAALRVRPRLRQRLVPAALRPARSARWRTCAGWPSAPSSASGSGSSRRARAPADDWQRFSLYTFDDADPGARADTGFALLPTAPPCNRASRSRRSR